MTRICFLLYIPSKFLLWTRSAVFGVLSWRDSDVAIVIAHLLSVLRHRFFASNISSFLPVTKPKLGYWLFSFQGQGACNHFQWLDEIAGKPPETGNADLNELKLKLASSDPVLQDNKNIGENKAPKMNCNGEAHEIDDAALMQLPLDEPPVLRSPPVSPKRQPQASDEIRTSPMKRLSLHDGVPSVPGIGKCYRCGRKGHWMAECALPAVSPCFKCGKPGHWMKDCPKFRWLWSSASFALSLLSKKHSVHAISG